MALVDYGSSTDEEEEEEKLLSSNKKTENENVITINKNKQHKRSLNANNDPQHQKRTKTSLPPLPTTLTDMFKDRERPPDNPEKHQGRIRARAHVDGSWPVHVYLEVKLNNEMFDIVSTLTKSARAVAPTTVSMLQSIESLKDLKPIPVEATTAADATELHISLTRPLYLQELHLGRFTSDVRDAFKKKKRFNISFSGIQSFSNDEKTRSFLSLRVGSGHAELERLVVEMDAIAERYCQPKFYEDPQFHASFAWAVGGDVLTEKTIETMSELQGELGHDLRHCPITIRRVAWKTGQKIGSVALIS